MCGTCGCGDGGGPRFTRLGQAGQPPHDHLPHDHLPHDHLPHDHLPHDHPPHDHPHDGDGGDGRTVVLEQRVLSHNDALAVANRADFTARGLLVVDLMSSPGSGKTTLLEATIRDLGRPVAVVEGDQETLVDAERIRAAGAPVVQVNTGSGCHLDAGMLRRGIADLAPADGTLVLVENVGNLVCPALFDLGEHLRVVVMSVPEGDDKPAKYPHMFRTADLVLVNKVDLLPYVSFDLPRCREQLRRLQPAAEVLPVSATRGDGMDRWLSWLRDRAARAAPGAVGTIDNPGRAGV